ncbi:MAG: heparinase II/III family protein [Armatimonadia bacterium]
MEKCLLLVILLLLSLSGVSAKQARTYYDEAFMSRLKGKIAGSQAAKDEVAGLERECAWILAMSDQELWDFVPPPEQMRAINVCIAHDCPICGDEVNRKAGHYPWITSREQPFKVKCPVCQTVFPSNDFKPWNTEGLAGKPVEEPGYADNGVGWVDKKDGRRYYFVSYYIFWQRWSKDVLGGLNALRAAYLCTGKAEYAHKAGVMLAKIGSEYERFDYRKQCYHEGMWGINGRISDYIWSTGNDSNIALTFDAVYPGVAEDKGLEAFLAGKGLGKPGDVIEKMLWVMVKDVMTGYVAGNMGMHQLTLANLALVLKNDDPQRGPTSKDMTDWIMRGGGRMEDLLWNGFYREGLGAESSPGYSSGWCTNFYNVAQLLPRLGLNVWSNPKLRKMADIGRDLTVAGRFSPSIGDSGRLTGTSPIALTPDLQGTAFMQYRDAKYARMLKDMGASSGGLMEDYFDGAAVDKAAEGVTLPELKTRNLGGYGCAILETGAKGRERALSMYYGDAGGGHGHFDRLNVEMFSHGRVVMPEDGYPTPFTRPDFYEWRRADTYKHYCVMVDELPQMTYEAGDLEMLVGTPGVQVVEASAERAYPELATLYRRTSALVDISPEQSYLLDVWRVRGGKQHDWCYHAGAPEMTVTGGALGAVQTKGTLAGEEVAYGKQPPARATGGDLAVDLAHGEGVVKAADYWKQAGETWTPHGKGILTTKPGVEMSVKIPALAAGKYKLFVEYWDHKPGLSEVELRLGETVVPVKIETKDGKAYKWQSQVFELPAKAETLKLKAVNSGINYIMINSMVIGRDLTREEPLLATASGVSSGLQGLWNVQRMRPEKGWSATWNHWDQKDLAITMTMPAGCAQEVIVADGEPEAQTSNPRTIKYALARNVGEPGMLSKYVAVVEPHVGAAAVSEVRLLEAAKAAPEAVGVAVRRTGGTDFVHSAVDTSEMVVWDGAGKEFAVQGQYALVTVDEQGVQRALLVNGTRLKYGDFSLEVEASPAGKVVAVDPAANAITVEGAVRAPEAMVDRVVILGNELQRGSYTIKSAAVKDGKTVLGFGDVLFIVGTAMAEGFDEAAGTVQTVAPLAGYGKIEGGRHAGRWLYNEDKTESLKILSASGNVLKVAKGDKALAEVYKDADGDGRRQMWISDVGPGDVFRIPATTWVQRTGKGVYRVQTMTRAEVGVGK